MPGFLDMLDPGRSIWGTLFGSEDTPAAPAQAQAPATDPRLHPTAAQAAPVMSHWVEPGASTAAAHRPEKESVVYLGINDASREKEKQAFAGMDNATVINGAGTNKEMQGKVMAADGKTVLDLGSEADLTRYLNETGVGGIRKGADGKPIETAEDAHRRMGSLQDLFLGAKDESGQRQGGLMPGVRDEMAGFLKVLQGVETGQRTMDRVVMSGHSTGEWVYSEAEGNPGVTFEQMGQLMSQFPQAQAGVKDLMLSACHTLENGERTDNRDGQQYQDIFPNVDSVWGYNGYSPSYKQGSVQHIRNWLKASEGDDPAAVARAAKRTGQNATAKTFE